MDPKILLRRVANRARLSPNPRVRQLFELVRATYRLIGRWFPFLHFGWMASLRRAVWDGDDLVLNGWAFVRGADQGSRPEYEIWLHRRFSRERIRAAVSLAEDPDVLGAVPRAELNYRDMIPGPVLGRDAGRACPIGDLADPHRHHRRRAAHLGPCAASTAWLPGRHAAAAAGGRPAGPDRRFHERRGVLIVTRPQGVLVRDVTLTGREISLRSTPEPRSARQC